MKLQVSLLVAAVGATSAFAPSKFATRPQTARSFGVEPSMFHDLPNQVQSLQDAFSTISLSDAMEATADALQATSDGAVSIAADAVQATGDAVVVADTNGGFGFLTGPITSIIEIIHSGIAGTVGPANAWGISIIALTLLIKVITFPLTKTQLESTNKMQVRMRKIPVLQVQVVPETTLSQTLVSILSCRLCNQLSKISRLSTRVTPRL